MALDDDLSEQIKLLTTALSIHASTDDAQVLKEPFEQMGLYKDILSYAEIIKTWNQYRAMQPPSNK